MPRFLFRSIAWPGPSADRRRAIVSVVAAAMFMESLDSTIIATALPAMARSFSTAPVDISLGISAYMLSLAVFIPISGWMSDRFGARPLFQAAIAVFTISSVLCGICPNLASFVAARMFQGLGGAMMVPVGRLILLRSVPKTDLIKAFSLVTLPSLFAPLLGGPIGGLITVHLGWRWIFYLNMPIGLAGIVAALLVIPAFPASPARRFDWLGFALTGLSVSSLLYGLELANRPSDTRTVGLTLLAIGLASSLWAVRYLLTSPDPVVDLSLLRIRTYAMCLLGGAPYRIACGALPLVLPLFLQIGLDLSPFQSGLYLVTGAVGGLMTRFCAKPLLRRFGFRRTFLVNGVLSALSIGACAQIGGETSVAVVALILMAGGFCRSLQFTSLMAIAWADMPEARTGAATSLFGMAQQLSFGTGIAFGAIVLRFAEYRDPSGIAGPAINFPTAFYAIAILCLLDVLCFLALDQDDGAALTARTPSVEREATEEPR